jgi:ankyrin repeat protein
MAALIMAVRGGHKDVVWFLVSDCAADVNIQDTQGQTALMMVVCGGQMKVVRFLVGSKAR